MRYPIALAGACLLVLAGCAELANFAPSDEPAKPITEQDLLAIIGAGHAGGIELVNLGDRELNLLRGACAVSAITPTRYDAAASAICKTVLAIGTPTAPVE